MQIVHAVVLDVNSVPAAQKLQSARASCFSCVVAVSTRTRPAGQALHVGAVALF